MIEFLYYLNNEAKEIYSLASKNFDIIENDARICRNGVVANFATKFDFLSFKRTAKIIVCTDQIKKDNTIKNKNAYFAEALYHEVTHAVQFCKGKKENSVPLGIYKNIVQTSYIKKMSEASYSASSYNFFYNNKQDDINMEVEAYYLESKPKELKPLIKKYCM
jgi:hypothetical protein